MPFRGGALHPPEVPLALEPWALEHFGALALDAYGDDQMVVSVFLWLPTAACSGRIASDSRLGLVQQVSYTTFHLIKC